jgi:uncharacterized protein (DUF169 family)
VRDLQLLLGEHAYPTFDGGVPLAAPLSFNLCLTQLISPSLDMCHSSRLHRGERASSCNRPLGLAQLKALELAASTFKERFPEVIHDYSKLSAEIIDALRLKSSPIAICFADEVPSGLAAPTGRAPAGCRFWQDATSASFATSAVDHSLCAIGVYTHNLESSPAQQNDLMDAIKVFGDLGYVTPQDLPLIPVLRSQPKHVVYAPLGATPLAPDVVLLFADAAQSLILCEATQQVEGGNAPAMGRPACAVVPQVANSGRAAMSLGCCGARAYLDILADSISLFAFPGAMIESYAERIVALASANAVLSKFHQIRNEEIHAGLTPSIQQSLRSLAAS